MIERPFESRRGLAQEQGRRHVTASLRGLEYDAHAVDVTAAALQCADGAAVTDLVHLAHVMRRDDVGDHLSRAEPEGECHAAEAHALYDRDDDDQKGDVAADLVDSDR